MKKRVTIGILLCLLCLALIAGCGTGTQPTQNPPAEQPSEESGEEGTEGTEGTEEGTEGVGVTEGGRLVMGLDDSFAPMGFRDESGEIVGFDVDLAKEAAARLGMELVLQPIDWDSKEVELSSGNIDCIWNGLTITAARQESMEMSKPYIANNQVIVVVADGGVSGRADLEGKEIGVQKGSSALDAVNADELAALVSQVSEYPQNVDAFNDLKAGRLSAVVADEIMARYYLATEAFQDLILLEESLAAEEYGIAFRKGNTELRDAVQAALDEMVADGAAGEISQTWFGADIIIK
ncbi:MAG: amino acid ABC transporter substrate-binding protein [Gracilibacteraceae bacterium]|jgi:polar amino acid transport system substrate-binding protein|nr:amino acid ABC transporter substrate-binding protein [Gracilibacteraceae bacterium]